MYEPYGYGHSLHRAFVKKIALRGPCLGKDQQAMASPRALNGYQEWVFSVPIVSCGL